jgi:hypothetical protein
MAKPEISSWLISASSVADNGDNDHRSFLWHRDGVLDKWPQALEHAQSTLVTGKTRLRINFLQHELLPLVKRGGAFFHPSEHPTHAFADLTMSQALDMFELLTLTYPRYTDTLSRDAVQAVVMELVRRDEVRGTGTEIGNKFGVTDQVFGWLSTKVDHLSKHGQSTYVSLSLLRTSAHRDAQLIRPCGCLRLAQLVLHALHSMSSDKPGFYC